MSEEKSEKHEGHEHHEHSEAKTITIKKDALWKGAVFVLLAALVVSMFTGGFGIGGTGKVVANTNNNANSGSGANAYGYTNPQGPSTIDMSTFRDSSLFPSLGPSDAKYTVVEFADFQCPYCALASGLPNWTSKYTSQYGDLIGIAKNIENLAEQGKVRFIFVTMNFLDHGNIGESNWAAEAAYCAEDQGKFWQMHDAIYAASTGPTEDDGKYSKANLKKIAATISGLDTSKFNSCLDNDTKLSMVSQAAQAAAGAGVSGTPMFFVNGNYVPTSKSTIMSVIGQ